MFSSKITPFKLFESAIPLPNTYLTSQELSFVEEVTKEIENTILHYENQLKDVLKASKNNTLDITEKKIPVTLIKDKLNQIIKDRVSLLVYDVLSETKEKDISSTFPSHVKITDIQSYIKNTFINGFIIHLKSINFKYDADNKKILYAITDPESVPADWSDGKLSTWFEYQSLKEKINHLLRKILTQIYTWGLKPHQNSFDPATKYMNLYFKEREKKHFENMVKQSYRDNELINLINF